MDSRMRQSLDNYITGGRYRQWQEDIECKECGYQWEVTMCEEYGMSSFVPDEQPTCPRCKTEYDG